ncbi:hypothetical protein EWM64_g520 [Hericium alpestre]|uniref:SET domain-containing protein n=1 Tax=Hericium alpestre TaxID=135208 RepID=A0A4Z0AB82_9AGAM|nr:hypothetical protein EWM64_g520 [Hericium alpestre]
MLRLLLARMEPEKQRTYRELANAHTTNRITPLLGVLRTNAIMLPEQVWRKTWPGNTSEDDEKLSGVCEVLSRINHSCRPNAVVDFHIPSFTYVLTAARTIPAGTEITRTYIENAEPAADRQLALRPYGFRCRCAACASPRVSDLRRWQIVKDACEPLPAVRAWMRDPALTDDHLIRVSKRVLQLGQEEGMEASAGFYGAHLLQLTLSYAALGERERYLEARERMLALGRCHHPLDGQLTGWLLPKVPEEQVVWGHRVPALD